MSFLAGVDRVIIPEVPYNPERLAHLSVQDKRETPANYAVIVVCDGSRLESEKSEAYADLLASHEASSSGIVAARLLGNITGSEVFLQPLTYLLRTGLPDGQDLLGGVNFAFLAARLVKDGEFGRMTAFVQEKMWTDVDLQLAIEGVKEVNVDAWYDAENYKPKLSLIWSIKNS
jgi:6-phosphofructokinase 1